MDTTLEQRRSDEKQIKELLQGYRPDDGPATGRLLGMLWPRINAFACQPQRARTLTRELFLSGWWSGCPASWPASGSGLPLLHLVLQRDAQGVEPRGGAGAPDPHRLQGLHELFPDRPEIRQARLAPADLDALDLRLLASGIRTDDESPAREMEALGLLEPRTGPAGLMPF
jgi:hypothetical protein